MLTDRDIYEILSVLKQYEEIMKGELVLINTEEVTQRVLRGIKFTKLKLEKELSENKNISKCVEKIKGEIEKYCKNCPDKKPLCSLTCVLGKIWSCCEKYE